MNEITVALEHELLQKYGPIIGNEDLRIALGFPTMNAFRQALSRKTVPVPVFSMERRRGKFALVRDVAGWLAEQRQKAVGLSAEEAHMS